MKQIPELDAMTEQTDVQRLRAAHATLVQYNAWRRDESDDPRLRLPMPKPIAIGIAIDLAIEVFGKMIALVDGEAKP